MKLLVFVNENFIVNYTILNYKSGLMKTKVIYPKNPILKKYIKYFLFINSDNPNYKNSHISYPNTNHCLGLQKNSKLICTSNGEYDIVSSNDYHSYLTGIYSRPVTFNFFGKFDEICIDFEPLGIEEITGYKVSHFKFLNSVLETIFSKDWQHIYEVAFEDKNLFKRAEKLESFFLSNLKNDKNLKYISFNELYGSRVEELKERLNISYRSINRLYNKTLGISPKEFLNIRRLRNSMDSLRRDERDIEIAYKLGFFDQSHLIREFKKYTNQTPRKFSNSNLLIDNNVWLGVR